MSNKRKILFFLALFFLAGFFRLYGLNWDQGQHLHPDERFLTMVLTSMKIPKNITEYLNPKISPMNPYNIGYSFFVYGTLPLNLTKIVGVLTNKNNYGDIHLIGRILSAVFDVGTIFMLFKIGKKIFNEKIGLLAGFLYSIMVLPIQLSHFFAVDTFLNFFLVLSFYFLILLISSCPPSPSKKLCTAPARRSFSEGGNFKLLTSSALGGAFGLALACKISALYFLPIIGLGYLFWLFFPNTPNRPNTPKLLVIVSGIITFLSCYLVFRITQPSFFSSGNFLNFNPNPKFISNLKEQSGYCSKDSWMPPVIQWKSTKPIIFPLKNLILWGVGLPLGIISLVSFFCIITSLFKNIFKNKLKKISGKFFVNGLIALWILALFAYEGIQICKTIRYFLPIYPFLALISAVFLTNLNHVICKKIPKSTFCILHFAFYIMILVYPISFMSIYSHPITRVSASQWIYGHVPPGSPVLNEEWDDGLPLPLLGHSSDIYPGKGVFMYDPDTPEKWQRVNTLLKDADYFFITSNRAYGSTAKLPDKYPQTIKFYQSLFNSSGNFKKVAEFISRPCFPPIGKHLFCFNDDGAEESFTVYDHPKVMIFKKEK